MTPVLLAALSVLTSVPATASAPCADPEHHQFDFWIGAWDVSDARTGERAGTSFIESLYGGCVLRENWSQPGWAGGSLNIYAEGKWRQTWVDQSGAWRDLAGSWQGDRMVMFGQGASKEIKIKMSFIPAADGSVRQLVEASKDEGASWVPRIDLIYRRAH